MEAVTLALGILLAAGFLAAKAGQLVGLPSVTGYILAGLVLGPSGINLVNEEIIGQKLEHFTQIALMLIAFGIGEHLELQRLREKTRIVGCIGLGETSGAFILVASGTFLMAWAVGIGGGDWGIRDLIVLGLLLGAVSVATAPAATLHVMRELRAGGPLTSTLMAVVALDDGLAIMAFGIAVSAARQITGSGMATIWGGFAASTTEILISLIMGITTGLLIDFAVHRLRRRGEMLTAGLALLLLCGEGARLLHLSPLLAGMAAGFTIVNRDRRDVRIFRAINAFEPPIYVLFFTLAGAHLHLPALAVAGWVGLVYFLLRALGKVLGAHLGAGFASAPSTVRRFLGLALIPQAGVAIGLIFLIKGDSGLGQYSSVIIPVVLGSVVLSELTGPLCARFAVKKAGEVADEPLEMRISKTRHGGEDDIPRERETVQLVPWTWGRLEPRASPEGVVIFGASHRGTVAALARIATLLAHHHGARLLAARILTSAPSQRTEDPKADKQLLALAKREAEVLGYPLETEVAEAKSVSMGILSIAQSQRTFGIVLGHPIGRTAQEFQSVVDDVARQASCPVLVIRFSAGLRTERILAPVSSFRDLEIVRDVILALARVGEHQIKMLLLMPSNVSREELAATEQQMHDWVKGEKLHHPIFYATVLTESRLTTILKEAAEHDLLVMATSKVRGLQRLFFGSLAEDVAQHCQKPMIMVRGTRA